MLLKECKRCKKLITYGKTFCEACAPIAEEERQKYIMKSKQLANKKYDKERDLKFVRFYKSLDWRVLSAKYMQDKAYRCELCGSMATQVHHKQAIQIPEGWERRFDCGNLELLCTRCHNLRHKRFGAKPGGVGKKV